MPVEIKIQGKQKFTVNGKTVDKLSDKEKAMVDQFIKDWKKYFSIQNQFKLHSTIAQLN